MKDAVKELLDDFNGTKEEWAEYWIEYHMIPTAKDYDNTETEFALTWALREIRRLRKLVAREGISK